MAPRCRSVCGILPPHLLEQIVRNGTDEQRSWAINTMTKDFTLRSIRAQNALLQTKSLKPLQVRAVGEGQPVRTIFDCDNEEDLRARIVRREGDSPTGDLAVDEAYDGLGATYDLYWQVYERDSIDDEGMPLDAYVHYGKDYDNAFWDGRHMVFGDGDGALVNRLTIAVDVMGHELAHGVTADEAGLVYSQQPGALNESLSDVFGSLVKQRTRQETADQADWLIGAGLLTSQVKGVALRSLKAPGTAYDDPVFGKDPQPAHMRDYVQTTKDNGGVHINSGIPNRAFYLAAVDIGGYAWEKAGRIWYEALRDQWLRPTSRFLTFAGATLRAAVRLGYSESSTEYQAVRQAWEQVGITV